jgi:hypothetical protein
VYSPFGKTTNSPYNAMISTVVTYFDGPLDRDRIDGSYMACDWVRMYKETSWKPKVESLTQISPTEWELKFNKPMDAETINNSTVLVFDSNEKPINLSVRVINNMRYVLKFNQGFTSKNNYKLKITGLAKDIFGESLFEKNEGYFYLK